MIGERLDVLPDCITTIDQPLNNLSEWCNHPSVDLHGRHSFLLYFSGLGCLSVFSHKPLLNPNVPPVIQPLRRVPLAMRDKVTTELQGMLAADLIEPIDASPWVSNLVIVQKRSGGMRLCIDLRGPNKAVVPDNTHCRQSRNSQHSSMAPPCSQSWILSKVTCRYPCTRTAET